MHRLLSLGFQVKWMVKNNTYVGPYSTLRVRAGGMIRCIYKWVFQKTNRVRGAGVYLEVVWSFKKSGQGCVLVKMHGLGKGEVNYLCAALSEWDRLSQNMQTPESLPLASKRMKVKFQKWAPFLANLNVFQKERQGRQQNEKNLEFRLALQVETIISREC